MNIKIPIWPTEKPYSIEFVNQSEYSIVEHRKQAEDLASFIYHHANGYFFNELVRQMKFYEG